LPSYECNFCKADTLITQMKEINTVVPAGLLSTSVDSGSRGQWPETASKPMSAVASAKANGLASRGCEADQCNQWLV
jgi:hypothetical protein